jgi:hypothetical protein
MYKQIFVLDLFHILWYLPVLDLRNVNKFNSIQFNSIQYGIFRGMARSLWIGVLWALPSGTGVALALLQGSAGPLIGVAISASLLPPTVNCVSICFSHFFDNSQHFSQRLQKLSQGYDLSFVILIITALRTTNLMFVIYIYFIP